MPQDPNVLPKVFSSGAIKFMAGDLSDRGQLKNVLLKKFNVDTIDQIGLSGIVLSHAHVDHYGNLLNFPTSLPVFVGPGTMDWVGGGEDAAEKGEKGLISFPSSLLKNHSFIEMDRIASSNVNGSIKERVKTIKVGPFDQAWDWFGDGSIIIASAEGVGPLRYDMASPLLVRPLTYTLFSLQTLMQHCHGHMVLLAKTTSSPEPSYVLLSGDAAHQQALYHPLPPPLQLNAESLCSSVARYDKPYALEADRRATPGYFDRTSAEAVTDRAIPDDQVSCMQDFPDKAMRTLAALSRMEACADVMVVL